MPKVYMYPNPRLGMPVRGVKGAVETSIFMADPHVAKLAGVEAVLTKTASTIAARASARLNTVKILSERSAGPKGSFIEMEHGYLDFYVILNDERSDSAAAAIERDHGILKASSLRGIARLARREEDIAAKAEPDPVKGGFPDAP